MLNSFGTIGSFAIVVLVRRFFFLTLNLHELIIFIPFKGTLTNQCSLQGEPSADTDTLYDSAGKI